MTLKCIVVDDESMARKLIEENIRQIPFLELVATCKNPFEAMQVLQEQHVDLMFLDIQMPGMLGTKFLQTLREKPMVILVTAYSNYALEGYELEVIDYLMKPVSLDRFTKACYKALEFAELKQTNPNNLTDSVVSEQKPAFIFINVEYSLVKIVIAEISHIEGLKDYIKIFLSNQARPILTKSTLKGIEEKIDSKTFFRVHKSFIVNLEKIDSIRGKNITIGKHEIPVSDTHVEELLKLLNYNKQP